MGTIIFILFAGLAVGCALSMVVQRNPLYSAISLVGVFISLAALYVTLAAPFIVLVVFVIMLLNVEEEERGRLRLKFLIPTAIVLAGVLVAEAAFVIYFVEAQASPPDPSTSPVGLTASIGTGLFTTYLLPFEITSVLLLMAIVGAMTLARRANILPEGAHVIPGSQVLTKQSIDPRAIGDATPVITHSTAEAAQVLGEEGMHDLEKR
jgi:NADH-quinone oxidoreductase subunit J